MKFFTLFSGHTMPAFGLGTWNSDPGVVGEAVKTAIEIGYRHIDCAHVYGNEAEIGQALKSLFDNGAVKREDLFITSKLWNSHHHPDDVESALNRTLENLGLPYLDLYLIHWPVVQKKDASSPFTDLLPLGDLPIADTWRALEKCVDKGLVRDIGVSNFSVKKLKQLMSTARIKPSVNQVERHPYLQNPELYNYCKDNGILITAYSPLGTRSVADGFQKNSITHVLDHEVIVGIAKKHGATPAQVLIAWAIACDTSVIPKSTRKERLEENLKGVDVALDADDLAAIRKLDLHRRYVDGTFWTGEGSPYTIENIWDEEHLTPKDEL